MEEPIEETTTTRDLTAGLQAMRRSEWAVVIERLEPLRSSFPELVELHYALGLAYFQQRRFDEAAAILRIADQPEREDAGQQAEVLLLLGMARYGSYDLAGADAVWRRLLEAHPLSPLASEAAGYRRRLAEEAETQRADAQRASAAGDHRRALSLLLPLAELHPEDAELALALGEAAYGAGDARLAVASADRALELGCDDPASALVLLTRAQAAVGDHAAAVATRQRLAVQHPDAVDRLPPESSLERHLARSPDDWQPSVFGRAGWYYDSNPGLVGDELGLDSAEFDEDQYLLLDVYAQLRQPDGWGVSLFGMLNDYQDADVNDLGFIQGRLDHRSQFGDSRWEIGLQSSRTWLGGDHLLDTPAIDLGWLWRPVGPDRWRWRIAVSAPIYAEEVYDDREGMALDTDLRWRRRFGSEDRWTSDLSLAVGRFDAEAADESYYRLEPRARLCWRDERLELSGSVRSRWRFFDEGDPGEPAEEEWRLRIEAEALYAFNRFVGLGVSFAWHDNQSNIATEEWDRFEAGLVLSISWY